MSEEFSQTGAKAGRAGHENGEDELDLAALFRAIWNTRKLVGAVALLTALALIGLLAFTKLALPTTYTYQAAVRFVFPGVGNGIYPNSSRFTPSDMLAPAVLQQAYMQNKLAESRIKYKDFVSAISLHPYSPVNGAVISRYNARLANKKLSFVERKGIEKEMVKELAEVSGRGAILRFTLQKRTSISPELAQKSLHDIARKWAKFSIEQRGVLKLPDAVSKGNIVDIASLSEIEMILVTERLRSEKRRLTGRLEKLMEQSGSNTIVDPKSGLSLLDLLYKLKLYRNYDLAALQATILNGHHFRDKNTLLDILRQRTEEYSLIKDESIRKAAAIETSLQLYANRKMLGDSSGQMASRTGPAGASEKVVSGPQLGEGFIDRLIDLTKQEKDTKYRQDLINTKIGYHTQSIEAETSRKKIMELIKAIETVSVSGNASSSAASGDLKKSLAKAVEKLNRLGAVAARLFEAMSEKRLSYNGQLYVMLDLPKSERAYSYHPLFNKNIFIIIFLPTLAMAIFAMFAGLIWQMMRSGRR